jgi:hypothetical protein
MMSMLINGKGTGEESGRAMSTLEQTLDDVRQRMARHQGSVSINEQNTKATLIEPVLRALGWDLEDLEEVQREYKRKRQDKPVDYALLVLRTPKLFIEAKALGSNLDERKWAAQIMSYATVAGVTWVVLTDGNEYRLYNAHAPVAVERKLFRTVRVADPESPVEETLQLLSRREMEENRIETMWKAHFVDRQVHGELLKIFGADPDGSMVRLLRKRIGGLSPGEIRASLQRAQIQLDFPVKPSATGELRLVKGERVRRKRSRRRAPAPPGTSVRIQDLISAGIIRAPLDLEREYKGHRFQARIEADGSVTWNGQRFNSLSQAGGAARASVIGTKAGGRVPATNGWAFWQHRGPGGKLEDVGILRDRLAAAAKRSAE